MKGKRGKHNLEKFMGVKQEYLIKKRSLLKNYHLVRKMNWAE